MAWGVIALVAATVAATATALVTGNARWIYPVAAFWGLGAPIWFWCEYFFLYCDSGDDSPVEFERFRYGQQLSIAIWAGLTFSLFSLGSYIDETAKDKGPTSLTVPKARDVTIVCFYENQELPPLKFVANEGQREDIVLNLRALRWKEPGERLAEIDLIRPDIDFLLTDEFGTLHTYQCYWDHNSLLEQSTARLFVVNDISGLMSSITSVTGLKAAPRQGSSNQVVQ